MHLKTKKHGFTLKYVVWDNYTTGTVWWGIYHRLNTAQCHTEQLFSVSMTQNFLFVTKRYALKNLYKCVSALVNIVKKHISAISWRYVIFSFWCWYRRYNWRRKTTHYCTQKTTLNVELVAKDLRFLVFFAHDVLFSQNCCVGSIWK